MPPDYESESFWNDRFKSEQHFEWLGDGWETIVPVLRQHLQAQKDERPGQSIARTLHIGAGSSTLSERIIETYREICGAQNGRIQGVVVNTDFADEAVARGRQTQGAVDGEVQWERMDLLRWEDYVRLRERIVSVSYVEGMEESGLFELVVDKSTSDAVTCGEDIEFSRGTLTDANVHPLIAVHISHMEPDAELILEPLEMLALHLASLVKPGGLWIALSYSDHRFPFLVISQRHQPQSCSESEYGTMRERIAKLWELIQVECVDASSGKAEGNSTVHAPVIQHHLYTLRRTGVSAIY
jgi:hypothetical protein